MSGAGQVLLVDDDAELTALLERGLARRGFAVTAVATAEAALAHLERHDVDLVITDLHLQKLGGLALTERVVANRPGVPVIVITAFGSLDTAIAAIRTGAYDFLTKPVQIEVLAIAAERAVAHHRMTDELVRLREQVHAQAGSPSLGESAAMRQVDDVLGRVAGTDASVLITGESGTGKELVARELHRRSRRAGGPLVAINCAAMPEQLLESELFGHVRGAFTDAKTSRPGLFVQASGGSLFLDEIGELPVALQAKLLRALQERKVRPIGGDAEVEFDVRLISATNRDLEARIEERAFRDDLYYRINVVHVPLPPLRARGGDVLRLAHRFMVETARRFGKDVTGISATAAAKLTAYAWPGNVRELGNAIERAVAMARFSELTVEDLPDRVRSYTASSLDVGGEDPTELLPLEAVERRYILHVLKAVGNNRTLASQVLGLDRKTLYRKLKGYGVDE
ncbi:MAG: sigma-54 dependent transcriptional regulator [Kofleriaceae bacterium]